MKLNSFALMVLGAAVVAGCGDDSSASNVSAAGSGGGAATDAGYGGAAGDASAQGGAAGQAGGSQGGGGSGGEADGGAGGPQIGTYDVDAGVLSNQPAPGFCDPEVYTKEVGGKLEYYLRDKVQDYSDSSPRRFYVDYGYVGETLDYGPILRGGVYQVRCLRWSGDQWWTVAGSMESHVVWFRVPGPMNEAGAVPAPQSFQIQDNFAERHHQLLPAFSPLTGKLNPVYRWSQSQTLADLYGHGATHVSPIGNPGESDEQKLVLTTAIHCEAPWMSQLGVNPPPDNLDALGEAAFRTLTDQQLDEAASVQPPVGIYFTDLEKTTNYGDPTTWWSTNLEDATLPRYWLLLKLMRDKVPSRLLSDYYRPLVWSKSFFSPDDGNPDPGHPQWAARLSDPAGNGLPNAAWRTFTGPDNQQHSLRELVDVYIIDSYPGRGHGPFDGTPDKSDRSWTVYQIYSMVYDTLIARKLLPASAKVLWFGWAQTDNDQPSRLYIPTSSGRASYMIRNPAPAWWAQTTEMLGYIVGDGMHWWTEQVAKGEDPEKLGTGDGAEQWEPLQEGAPAPWTWSANPNGEGGYPRHHQYALTYGKLGQYQLSQVHSTLSAWEFATYSMTGGASSAPQGEATILKLAADRMPLVLLLGTPGQRAVFAVHPFGDFRQRYELTVQVDGGLQKVTLSGKWPTVVKVN